MKKHNKPEWVEDIEKAKSDFRTRKENQCDLLSRLYNSLIAVDTKSLDVYVFLRSNFIDDFDSEDEEYFYDPDNEYNYKIQYPDAELDVYSVRRSPHTMVKTYDLGFKLVEKKGFFEDKKVKIRRTEEREVEIRRKLICYLTETDDYCFEFFTLNTRNGSNNHTDIESKTTVSSQLIDASNEEVLEVDKVYDIYKWLTYNTDHIPLIGEVKTINKVNKADVKPIILILVALFIAIFILYLGMT